MFYQKIKEYYNKELYNVKQVEVFVKAKWITAEQFKEITRFDYEPLAE